MDGAQIGPKPMELMGIKVLPTVGRMVYYKTRGSADGVYPPTNFAAIITNVLPDDDGTVGPTVNLVCFGDSGLRFERKVAQGEEPGQWDWMPFQKDQVSRLAAGTPIAQPGGRSDVLAGASGKEA